MIESGSNVPGVRTEDFGLPPGSAFRYDLATPELRPLITGYDLFDSEPVGGHGWPTWALPGWAKIWINLSAGPIAVDIRNRHYAPIGSAIVYGTTSRAMSIVTNGGLTLGIEINPLAWARFASRPADAARDRITPMGDLFAPALVQDLLASLGKGLRAEDIQPALDAVFLRHLPLPSRDEDLLARMLALFDDGEVTDTAAATATLDTDVRTLRRVCNRHCGFPPKLLIMRARFLKALVPQLLGEPASDSPPPGYHDASHYLRDAERFLGMTPRRFLQLDTPYLRAVLRARRLVLAASQGGAK